MPREETRAVMHTLVANRASRWLAGWWSRGHRPQPRQRDLAVARLEQALAQPICPVCALADQADGKGLWILLWENVNDPGVRSEYIAALGHCPRHTRQLDEVARASGLGMLGQAILARDLIETIARRLERALGRPSTLARALETRAPCPVCTRRAATESSYLATLTSWSDQATFWESYAASPGLCLPHLLALPAEQASHRLLDDGLQRLRHIASALPQLNEVDWPMIEARLWGYRRPGRGSARVPLACPICQEQLAAEYHAVEQAEQPLCPEHASWEGPTDGASRHLAARYRPAVEYAIVRVADRLASAAATRSVRHWRRGWQGATPASVSLLRCPACMVGAEKAREVWRRGITLEASSLVCLPHLRVGLRQPSAVTTVQTEIAQLWRLAASLGEFIRKSDWNVRHEPRGEEQWSWPRARAFLIGPERGAIPTAAAGAADGRQRGREVAT